MLKHVKANCFFFKNNENNTQRFIYDSVPWPTGKKRNKRRHNNQCKFIMFSALASEQGFDWLLIFARALISENYSLIHSPTHFKLLLQSMYVPFIFTIYLTICNTIQCHCEFLDGSNHLSFLQSAPIQLSYTHNSNLHYPHVFILKWLMH